MVIIKKYALLIFNLFKDTAVNFSRDNGSMLAASLAYYTIFAIAPLLIIVVAVAGFVFGEQAVQGELVGAIQENVGREGAVLIQSLIASSSQNNANLIASIISIGLLVLAASGLFGQLQKAINIIWGVTPSSEQGMLRLLKSRALSFGMVLVIGLVLMISITASTIMTAISGYLAQQLPVIGPLLPRFELLVSFLILIFLFGLIFKVLPDAHVAWRDVLVGGLVTAVLFSFGKILIGYYLSLSDNPTYQAAGSIVILLLWIYYSSQILLFGAEFTQTFANSYGHSLRPAQGEVILPPTQIPVELQPVPVRKIVEVRQNTAVSRQSLLEKVGALLIGVAVGLLAAFVSTFWTGRKDNSD